MTGSPVAVVRRVLPAPPYVVFDEWLDPEGMTEWMCPRPARAVKIALEPVVGGALRIDIEDSAASPYVTGRFIELDRPRRRTQPSTRRPNRRPQWPSPTRPRRAPPTWLRLRPGM